MAFICLLGIGSQKTKPIMRVEFLTKEIKSQSSDYELTGRMTVEWDIEMEVTSARVKSVYVSVSRVYGQLEDSNGEETVVDTDDNNWSIDENFEFDGDSCCPSEVTVDFKHKIITVE